MNKNSERLITIYLGENINKNTQTLAYAKSEGFSVKEIDLTKEKLTGTQLLQLVNKLDIELEDLVDKESEKFKSSSFNGSYDKADWLEFIINHQEYIKTPIIQKGNHTFIVNTPTDTLKINQSNSNY